VNRVDYEYISAVQFHSKDLLESFQGRKRLPKAFQLRSEAFIPRVSVEVVFGEFMENTKDSGFVLRHAERRHVSTHLSREDDELMVMVTAS
jgi:hypothetical protein